MWNVHLISAQTQLMTSEPFKSWKCLGVDDQTAQTLQLVVRLRSLGLAAHSPPPKKAKKKCLTAISMSQSRQRSVLLHCNYTVNLSFGEGYEFSL